MEIKMNERLIKEFKEKKIAIKSVSTEGKIKELLKYLFPNSIHYFTGLTYYEVSDNGYICSSSTELPFVSVEDFFLPDFERGDKVLVSMNNMDYHERIFITKIEGANCPYVTVDSTSEGAYLDGLNFNASSWRYIRPIEKEVELSLEEISEKFNIPVHLIKIKK